MSVWDSAIERTRRDGYDSTAPANSRPQPGLRADCPIKFEKPSSGRQRPTSIPGCYAYGNARAARTRIAVRGTAIGARCPQLGVEIRFPTPVISFGCWNEPVVVAPDGADVGIDELGAVGWPDGCSPRPATTTRCGCGISTAACTNDNPLPRRCQCGHRRGSSLAIGDQEGLALIDYRPMRQLRLAL